jgi:hypothetical protein
LFVEVDPAVFVDMLGDVLGDCEGFGSSQPRRRRAQVDVRLYNCGRNVFRDRDCMIGSYHRLACTVVLYVGYLAIGNNAFNPR